MWSITQIKYIFLNYIFDQIQYDVKNNVWCKFLDF